ncbi:Scavenger receptor cysteine-rich type 1 protein M130 [Amphibalanus amphitrite]|uniref:Scavenger receptor cysteine-rich type 1 protein M130 n=1 Tax=Amphibalanus amphitrite TaxID=1232801 RepID=A0A6A4W423_AMPAM|nr:Scavenger receptor cysteine-rich type 1 protein M130 [Amphibalanus amphitrite]
MLHNNQQTAEDILERLPTKEHIDQSLTELHSHLNQTAEVLPETDQEEGEGVAPRRMLSDPLNTVSAAPVADRGSSIQKGLTERSARLVGPVVQVAALSPAPWDRSGLVKGRLLGAPCRGDVDCSSLRADTVCGSDGRCRCADGLQPVAGEACRPYPRLAEPCRATSDCRGATELAVCADGLCGCPRGLVNFNNTECRSPLSTGEPCATNSDCSATVGRLCTDGVCALRTCGPSSDGSPFQYRLVGGDSCSEGVLQFSFNFGSLWQVLCDSDWTQDDAAVACRSVGFSRAAPLPWREHAAVDTTSFLTVEEFECEGSEHSLTNCHRVYGRSACNSSEVAAVKCLT